MKIRSIILSFVGILFLSAAVLYAMSALTQLSPPAAFFIFLLIFLIMAAALFVYWFEHNAYILVDEMDAVVIFYKHTNNFAYFIDSDPANTVAPGRPYNLHKTRSLNQWKHKTDRYHHFINPVKERVEARITKKPLSVSGATDQIRTREGVPVKIGWSVGYNLDVTLIRPGIEYKIARAIPYYHENMIKGRAIHSLRYMVEQKTVAELYCTDAIKKLEAELLSEVTKRVQGLGFKDIAAVDVKVGPIEVPFDVEKAIEAAHERQLQTTTAVKSLEQLRIVISRFSDSDMERLNDLERLRILDEHGGGLSYEIATLKTVR
ncbi:MAG: SPFH domain-containing protein [Chloroflexota bacterium]